MLDENWLATHYRRFYNSAVDSDNWNKDVPPYKYIKDNYDNNFGARLSGLPGYTPPNFVVILFILKKILTIATFLTFVSTIIFLFTDSLPIVLPDGFSVTLYSTTTKTGGTFTLNLTPILCSVIGFIVFSNLVIHTSNGVHKVSEPHEEEYEEWLEKMKPSQDMYPPHQYWWTLAQNGELDSYELGTHLVEPQNIPETAPRAFRKPRKSEKLHDLGRVLVKLFFSMFFSVLFTNKYVLDQAPNEPIEGQIERKNKKSKRKNKFD